MLLREINQINNNKEGVDIAVFHLHLLKSRVQTRRSPRIVVLECYYNIIVGWLFELYIYLHECFS